jgi:hypothetical protein
MQLEVLLRGRRRPLAQDAVLATHPFQRVRREGGLLCIRVQVHTLLDDDAVNVVLQVEQVLRILGYLRPFGAELQTHKVASDIKTLVPLGLLLIADRKSAIDVSAVLVRCCSHKAMSVTCAIFLMVSSTSLPMMILVHGVMGSTGISSRTSQ